MMVRQAHHKLKGPRGFSLMELTIMIAIGAVMMVTIGRAALTLKYKATENRDYLAALNLGKYQMALMNNAAIPGVTGVGVESAQSAISPFTNFIPTYEANNVATSGANYIRQITVRIRRGSATGPVLIRLDTYRSDIITFGNGT